MANARFWGPNGQFLTTVLLISAMFAAEPAVAGDELAVEPGFAAVKLAEGMVSFVAVGEEELQSVLCGTPGKRAALRDEVSFGGAEGPVIVCTDLEEELGDQILQTGGLVFDLNGPTMSGARLTPTDVRVVDLFIPPASVQTSCGDWQLVVELSQALPSNGQARFGVQADGRGGAFTIEAKVGQRLRFTRLADGLEAVTERTAVYLGGGEWSSVAQINGYVAKTVYVDNNIPDCVAEAHQGQAE